jgi:hypothetical protein
MTRNGLALKNPQYPIICLLKLEKSDNKVKKPQGNDWNGKKGTDREKGGKDRLLN